MSWNGLLEQRNYLPPADIGSLLENLRDRNRWKNRTDGSYEELIEMAQNVDDSVHDYEETCNQLEILNKQMDASFDFAEKKKIVKTLPLRNGKNECGKRSVQEKFRTTKRD